MGPPNFYFNILTIYSNTSHIFNFYTLSVMRSKHLTFNIKLAYIWNYFKILIIKIIIFDITTNIKKSK